MHPSDRLRGTLSHALAGKHVVLGVSGSIAVVETVRIAHELKRHGATVTAVMTREAQRFLQPLALEFATGRPVVTKLTGQGEHVELCDGRKGSADVLLVAPATANTVAKMALGIDDSTVTSCATVAMGAGVPVVVAPAMHDVMEVNPAVRERMAQLNGMGVHWVDPVVEEEKAKLATPSAIADVVIRSLAKGPWVGRKAIVISGATAEPVDPIRVVTNRSSGRMGVALALALYHQGADVELWNAWGLTPLPSRVPNRRFETVADLQKMVGKQSWKDVDAIFMPAALSDFSPEAAKDKIDSSAQRIDLRMKPLPKVILEIRKRSPKAALIAFKAESEPKTLEARARDRLDKYGADMVVANTTLGFGGSETKVLLVTRKGKARPLEGAKRDVAESIVEAAGAFLPKSAGKHG